ncbi:unnamed protein product [Ilex paraguariensis]|uniref:Core Histone H2A/H2B/H3 domain-containing protein n=1 Tax=Ilex paraguariensis TaxID=185542 RepID=A0ABC8TYX4_9AQUA
MAPKKSLQKVVSTVVKKTKKFMEETVQVLVENQQKPLEGDKGRELLVKTIVVEDKEQDQKEKELVDIILVEGEGTEQEQGQGNKEKELVKIIFVEGEEPEQEGQRDKEREVMKTIIVEGGEGDKEKEHVKVIFVEGEEQQEQEGPAEKAREPVKTNIVVEDKAKEQEKQTQKEQISEDIEATPLRETPPNIEFEGPPTPKEEELRKEKKTQEVTENEERRTQEGKETDKKKSRRGGGERGKRKRKRRSSDTGVGYTRYVYKVMKQVHLDMSISSKAMTVLNNMMNDMFERLADEASRLLKYTNRRTLSSREIQGAVKLVLPGELGNHAISEGAKALKYYLSG